MRFSWEGNMVFNICRVLNIMFFSEFAGLLLSVSGQNCSINSSADIFLPWFTMRYCRNDRAFFPNFSGMTLPAHSSFPGRRRCQAAQTAELLFPPYSITPQIFFHYLSASPTALSISRTSSRALRKCSFFCLDSLPFLHMNTGTSEDDAEV